MFAVFRAYISEVLIPTFRVGDIVVMDNLTPHKNEETLALIEESGACVWFRPPYSPDLNPIEKMWSKVKQPRHRHSALPCYRIQCPQLVCLMWL